MIDTAEIQSLQKYDNIGPSTRPEIPPSGRNGNSENGIGRIPLSKTYKESSDRERSNKKALRDREIVIKEMEETGELLGRDHEFYRTIDSICHRLKPAASPDVNISLSDSGKAFTLQDKKTIVLSAGLLKGLETYLQTKGQVLTEDHLALIIGHEMSHWDEEAKNPHISERYCDTQGLMLCNKAGFNIDSAVEALEFLEFAEEAAKRDSGLGGEDSTTVNMGELTHPTSEDRRILVQSIANDPNAFLEGRYARATQLKPEVYGDFKQRADQWLETARRREMIASEGDIEREFQEARSLSQVLETFISSDEYFHANMSREFSQTHEYENLTLAMAVYSEVTDNDFLHLSKEDFRAQFRAGLIARDSGTSTPKVQPNQPSGTQFSTGQNLTPEQVQLIQDCLDGRFQNPMTILTSSKADLEAHHPQFAGFTFNQFFRGIAADTNQFIQPEMLQGYAMVKEAQNLDRARALGLQGKLEVDTYVADGTAGVTAQIAQERQALFDKTKFAVASSMLRLSQEGTGWFNRSWDEFVNVSSESVRGVAAFGPDYVRLQSQIADSLHSSGTCSTEEVASRISLSVLECGRYLEERSGVRPINPKTLASPRPDLGAFWVDNQETHQDLRDSFYNTHLSLAQGGNELGGMFGRPRVDPFIDSLNWSFYHFASDSQTLIGDPLDPYQIVINGDPTISIPFQDRMLDLNLTAPQIDFVGGLFDRNIWSTTQGANLVCKTQDPAIIRSLILESVTDSGSGWGKPRRTKIIEAVLNNDQVRTNDVLIRSILEEGIANHSLAPREIYQILE